MNDLPRGLRLRLEAAPSRVVAPVDVGAGQGALLRWAGERGLPALREAPPGDLESWLWWPHRREEVARWGQSGPGGPLPLLLTGADTLYSEEEWREALVTHGRWAAAHRGSQRRPSGLRHLARVCDVEYRPLARRILALIASSERRPLDCAPAASWGRGLKSRGGISGAASSRAARRARRDTGRPPGDRLERGGQTEGVARRRTRR